MGFTSPLYLAARNGHAAVVAELITRNEGKYLKTLPAQVTSILTRVYSASTENLSDAHVLGCVFRDIQGAFQHYFPSTEGRSLADCFEGLNPMVGPSHFKAMKSTLSTYNHEVNWLDTAAFKYIDDFNLKPIWDILEKIVDIGFNNAAINKATYLQDRIASVNLYLKARFRAIDRLVKSRAIKKFRLAQLLTPDPRMSIQVEFSRVAWSIEGYLLNEELSPVKSRSRAGQLSEALKIDFKRFADYFSSILSLDAEKRRWLIPTGWRRNEDPKLELRIYMKVTHVWQLREVLRIAVENHHTDVVLTILTNFGSKRSDAKDGSILNDTEARPGPTDYWYDQDCSVRYHTSVAALLL